MDQALSNEFAIEGYVRIDNAVAGDLIEPLRRRLETAGLEPGPGFLIKLGDDARSARLLATPALRGAFDALLGPGRWIQPDTLEDVRIKRPGLGQGLGWHIDVFEQGPDTQNNDPLSWRASSRCGDVGLLIVLLLSDVGPKDGATALRKGSHDAVGRRLAQAGAAGLSLGELLEQGIEAETAEASVDLTIGRAGTAFLCHPMLVHTALPHEGISPSSWALPAIRLRNNGGRRRDR